MPRTGPGTRDLEEVDDVLTGVVLVAAALTAGLAAGVFALYAHAIMPGLRRTDDRTFVGAFQSIDRAGCAEQVERHGPVSAARRA